MRGVTESLAGRAGILTLEGLSWAEIRRARPAAAMEELVWRGGFPELHANPDIDAVRFHGDYVATYLERDLRNDLQVGSLRDFDRFLRACAARTGGLLNMTDLGRDIGVTGPTVKTWLGALERGGQLGLLEPWFDNRCTGLTKAPKLYLLDSGLACFLTAHRHPDDLDGSPLAGALWETAVYGELRKHRANAGAPPDLSFFRNRTREVDFLCQRAGRIHLADAKWGERPRDRDLAQLKAAREIIGRDRVASCAVLCRTRTSHPLGDGIWAYAPEDSAGSWAAGE
jgi:predicted AAA+ superfamily ATPase